MNWSKEMDGNPELQLQDEVRPVCRPREKGIGHWTLVIALTIGSLATASWSYARFRDWRGAHQLDIARSLLDELLLEKEGPQWTVKADRAESHLLSAAESIHGATANLLLMALNCNRGATIRREKLLNSKHDEHRTIDLTIAALYFFRCHEMGLADQLSALALDRSDERARALRAATIIRYEMGRDEDVLTQATEWSQLVPDEPVAWQYLAYVYEDRGFWDDAISALKKQIELTAGPGTEPRQRLVKHLIKVGDPSGARREFDILTSNPPVEPGEIALLHASLLFSEGNLDEADRIVTQESIPAKDLPDALVLRARILLGRSDPKKAIEILKECIAESPANQDAHHLLGQALARIGNATEAKQQIETHRRLLDIKVKINSLERQAGQQVHNAEVRQSLASLYREIGLDQQAELWDKAAVAVRKLHTK